jgi:serine/threonine protein kinase
MLAPNTILQNRYRIVRELGRGGMGAVYESFDLRLSRTVALKETFAETRELHRAFTHEARLLANLRHPSLPNVLDHFIEGDGQFLVMEYIAGPDLAQMLLRRGSPFSEYQVLRWAGEMLAVLEYLHGHVPPVIHRDIKPANIKIGASGQVILLDFGLARGFAGSMTGTSPSRSITGYSPHYAPLEQIHGEKSDPRIDIYAVAATLYHLLTGQAPEESLKRASSVFANSSDPLKLASRHNPAVSMQVSLVLARALSLNPHERPATAAEMRALLDNNSRAERMSVTQASPRPGPQPARQDEALYQTLVAKPELVVDPFSPPSVEQPQHVGRSKAAWGYTAFLVCALVAGIYLLYLSRRWNASKVAGTSSASRPAKPVIPSPYREALASVVSLELRDVEGKGIGQASGFFVKEDEIATDLSVIQGATQGRATVVDQHGTYDIKGVSAIDRERGIAILKVSGGNARPLPVAGGTPANSGSKVALLAASANGEGVYSAATVTDYRKKEELLEIDGSVDSSQRGGPVLNERGEVVAMLVNSPNETSNNHAVTSARLLSLMKSNQPDITLGMAGAKEMLYDFRQQRDSETTQKRLSIEEERKILSAIFKSYLTNESQCEGYEGDVSNQEGLRTARNDGYIVPKIIDSATGSFTAPGMQQTAYLIMTGECGAPHVVNWGTKRLAVFSEDRLLVNVDIQDHTSIIGTYDLNGDGINELLLTGGYAQSGYIGEWGAIISVKDSRLHFDKKLESVWDSTCASMATKPSVTAAVIYYTRGAGDTPPEIRVDNYQAKCVEDEEAPKPSAFRYISSGKLPKS